ncbi:hypothetical protein BDN70DRAFT_992496 [Pholiota conissans]|uniref:GH18 domain-containing protein n=1 Tax=Pholiota conissans TaxID=109636 RepID=A0A9P5Z3Z1_9AGAR|nr:hypothetical protein BDN70DRAFT_992496 [Pholiota conissans]
MSIRPTTRLQQFPVVPSSIYSRILILVSSKQQTRRIFLLVLAHPIFPVQIKLAATVTPDFADLGKRFASLSLKEGLVQAIVAHLRNAVRTQRRLILPVLCKFAVVSSDFAVQPRNFVELVVNLIAGDPLYHHAVHTHYFSSRIHNHSTGPVGADQQSATARRIGYYEGWAVTRSCMAFTPEQIPATSLTHVNFAFALISDSFQVIPMDAGDEALWQRTTNLKSNAPALKVFLSIGGWSFNDPPTQNIFSDLVASSGNTQTFIASVLSVMETYGFDGIDVDWEYPGAFDRGGNPSDTENYVNFMKAVKSAFTPHGYGLTFTAPSSYWYLQHFDLPGLLLYADWVNVMTYDLHGTWDGVDPFIGFVLGAHTNLTEIDEAFQLFWRVGVSPSQMVMGMGFYGRSFTLADPSCIEPPCPWVSGGNETILQTSSAQVVFDEVAAVKYVVWDSNQWVSYDDQDSFALKMNYANDHCIGGTMIWSVDQDDTSYTAMKDLYPGITALAGGTVESGDQCTVSPCGATSCGLGQVAIASVTTNPALPGQACPLNNRALLCCPAGNAPTDCTWRGGDVLCSPSCNAGEAVLATDPAGDGNMCLLGQQALCCKTNLEQLNFNCLFFECTSSAPTCPGPNSNPVLITVGTRGQGSSQIDASCTADNFQDLERLCPRTCAVGQVKPFCCSDPIPYQNCKWVGTPPLCLDNACAVGQVQLLTDPQGDASSSCFGAGTRSYCCDPTGSDFIPVPFDDIFPSTVPEGSETFTVDIDTDSGHSSSSSAEAVYSGAPDDLENGPTEEFTPFGEVFIDSPNPQSVSSLDVESHWVIVGCNPTSDQAQQVLAYCSKPMNESGTGCGHVFIGQAQHTIVKMPSSCGKGPYARVVGLDVHSDQNALPAMHNSLKPASESVHLLNFDYNFLAIPESNGPVYMRVDASDLPDYWDEVVDSPPERRQWLQERGLWKEKTLTRRWWGSFTGWLDKLNTVKTKSTTTRQFLWSDTYPIFSQSESCPGPPAFESSMNIEVSGAAQFSARYGFYLQGQIVPPSVQAAYLFFSSDADARADFTVEGTASVSYDSSMVQLASFGFPGLYYPGILTIGPSLVLEGYITGQLSISGQFTASLAYQFPSVDFTLGKSSSDQTPGLLNPTAVVPPLNKPIPDINWSVDLHGDLSVHIVPQVQMGVSILGGALVDAQAFIRADLGGGISITGSVSNIQNPNICINPYFSVNLDAGITGSLAFWETGPLVWPLFSDRYNFPPNGYCPLSLDTRELRNSSLVPYANVKLSHIPGIERRGAFIREVGKDGLEHIIEPVNRRSTALQKRAVPFIPGNLFCPAVGNQIAGADTGKGTDFDPYDDLSSQTLEDAFERREDLGDEDIPVFNISHIHELRKVTVNTCMSSGNPININAPTYSGTQNIGYFDLANPGSQTLNSDYVQSQNPPVAGANLYGREHVYELQMLSIFIDSLATGHHDLWLSPTTPSFCSWAKTYLLTPYFPQGGGNGQSVVASLQRCLPANSFRGTDLATPDGNRMVWLENIANGAKASAVASQTFRAQNVFEDYEPVKQVAVFRAAAGVMSYLNSGIAFSQFSMTHDCVNSVWLDWFDRYSKDPNLPAGLNLANIDWNDDFDNIYTEWIDQLLLDIHSNIVEFLQDMTDWFDGPQPNVPLDYAGNLRAANAQGIVQIQVTQADLQAETDRVEGQPITWRTLL